MNSLLHKNSFGSEALRQFGKAKQLVQPKLTINTPGDIHEQEADAMADRVMRMSSNEAAKPVTGLIGKSLQRKCTHCSEEEKRRKPIMRKAEAGNLGMSASSSFAASLNSTKGSGFPLPPGTRSFMENAFSADFSGVRVHTGGMASEMSRGINARAFTHGNDIYFAGGQYAPYTDSGKSLLAHELTHTLQQGGGSDMPLQRVAGVDDAAAGITIGALAVKCILGAIIGVLLDLGLQIGGSFWRNTTLTINYCSLIISAVISCIAAPIVSYGLEAWLAVRLAGSTYGEIVGPLIGRLLIWIVARAGMFVPNWMVRQLFNLGCINEEQNIVLQTLRPGTLTT